MSARDYPLRRVSVALLVLLLTGCLVTALAEYEAAAILEDSIANPSNLHPADLDDDGDIDLVSVGELYGEVCLHMNQGDGTFNKINLLSQVNGLSHLTLMDVEGNAVPELLVTSTVSGVRWYGYQGGGGMMELTVTTAPGMAEAQAGDLDNDGDMDVVTVAVNEGTGLTWYEATNQGYIANNVVGPVNAFRDLQLVDINKDNRLDIIAFSPDDGHLHLWLQQESGEFVTQILDSGLDQPGSLRCGDVDSDGDLDLLGVLQGADKVVWWEQAAELEFIRHEVVQAVDGAVSVELTDMTGDGAPDLLFCGTDEPRVRIWKNVGGGQFQAHQELLGINSPGGAVAAPISEDGILDVVAFSLADDVIVWWEQVVDVAFLRQPVSEGVGQANFVHAMDFDNDGDLDVIGTGRDPGSVSWFENKGPYGYQRHVIGYLNNPSRVHAIDFTENGFTDVFVALDQKSMIVWFQNVENQVFIRRVVDQNAYHARAVASADLDGDGDLDLAAAGGAFVNWYEQDDNLQFIRHPLDDFQGASGVRIADMNGDNLMDIVACAYHDNGIKIYHNHGDQIFSELLITDQLDDPHFLTVPDLDFDGDPDILATSTETNEAWWYENQGANFVPHLISEELMSPRGIDAADMDGDGDVDIAVAEDEADRISWLENVGNNNYQQHVVQTMINGPVDLYLIDRDNDGYPDVLGSLFVDGSIAWWRNTNSLEPLRISMDLVPFEPPVIVPPGEGAFNFDLHLDNSLELPVTGNIWGEMIFANGGSQVLLPIRTMNFEPGVPRDLLFVSQDVPALAPSGQITYRVNIGLFPGFVYVHDEMPFFKKWGPEVSKDNEIAWQFAELGDPIVPAGTDPGEAADLPNDIHVGEVYPNPFNASASVSVVLPDPERLEVSLYNVNGRRVAVLHQGPLPGGLHRFAVDGQRLASGLYFIRVEVADSRSWVRKVALLH